MTRESIDELRERLLSDDRVIDMIRVRAYEIYQFRGCVPGYEAEDWFQAEHEVLAFLIDQESRETAEVAAEKKAKKAASTKSKATRKNKAEAAGAQEGGEKKKAGKRAPAKKSAEGSGKARKPRSE